MDFHKALDSVHRELILLRGMPEKILALVRAFYADTGSVVRYGRSTSKFFPVTTRVRQGCVLAPSLFSVCMDWIMGRTISSPRGSFDDERFTSQDFTDDAFIVADTVEVLVAFLDVLSKESESLGCRSPE